MSEKIIIKCGKQMQAEEEP